MSNVVLSTVYTTLQTQASFISLKVREWSGRVFSHLNLALEHLKDPRIASASVFAVNFVIIELAERLTKLVKFLFLKNLTQHQNVEAVYSFTMKAGLITAGNVALIKMIPLPIHPLVVSALVVASWGTKWLLTSLVNKESQPKNNNNN